jgi:hypothetical protein
MPANVSVALVIAGTRQTDMLLDERASRTLTTLLTRLDTTVDIEEKKAGKKGQNRKPSAARLEACGKSKGNENA